MSKGVIFSLYITLDWSDFITVSRLRMDLRVPEQGGLSPKQFDRKYPILGCWGCYMYIDPDAMKICYIGSTARETGRSFRARLREELLRPTTTLCRELRNLGFNIETLSLKVATIKSVLDNDMRVNSVDAVKIEMFLICATGPWYDPHGPMHAKKDFKIHNIGNRDPLPEFLRMMRKQECRKNMP